MPDDPALELGAEAGADVVVVAVAGAADDEVVDAGAAVLEELEEPELPQPATRSAATTSASAPTPVTRLDIAFAISQSSVFVAVLMLLGEQDARAPQSFPLRNRPTTPGRICRRPGSTPVDDDTNSSWRLGCVVWPQGQS
jgi:hypothetical protein